jgi:hypothetical protein
VVRDAAVDVAAVVAPDVGVARDAVADEAAVREVVATLVVQPEGANVTVDGEPVVVRSGVVTVRRAAGSAVALRATAPGRVAREATVTLSDDVALRWTLAEVAPPRARGAAEAGVRGDAAAIPPTGAIVLPDGLHTSPYRYDAGR